MANREFKIQSDTISLNGVPLSSSVDGKVVIPGVTRATGYRVNEVEDQEDSDRQFSETITVIDYVTYQEILNETGDGSGRADYITSLDDELKIDEIEVGGSGTYTAQEATDNANNDMYAYIGTSNASDRPIVPSDWVQIPYRPKMKANSVESELGGSGSGDSIVNGENSVTVNSDGELEVPHTIKSTNGQDGLTLASNYSVRIISDYTDNDRTWIFDGTSGELQLPTGQGGIIFSDGSEQTTAYTGAGSLAPQLTKVEDEIVLTGTLHLGQAAGGSISELDSEGNINYWFNSATGDIAGRK